MGHVAKPCWRNATARQKDALLFNARTQDPGMCLV